METQALELMPQLFADHRLKGNETDEALKAELYSKLESFRCNWTGSKKSQVFRIEEKRSWSKRSIQT